MNTRVTRTKRTPISGTRNILNISGKEPEFEYRIVNDVDDRVAGFESQGYEIVRDKSVKVGDKRVANPTSEGSPVQVSVGGGVKAYVMRIKKEWYDEDQASKQANVTEIEASMREQAVGDYGSIKIGNR